uniref:Uncharacterized protein n=1 Tax=Setaria digitata TaxID=48799 RepID=A0A915Q4U4_9BILA
MDAEAEGRCYYSDVSQIKREFWNLTTLCARTTAPLKRSSIFCSLSSNCETILFVQVPTTLTQLMDPISLLFLVTLNRKKEASITHAAIDARKRKALLAEFLHCSDSITKLLVLIRDSNNIYAKISVLPSQFVCNFDLRYTFVHTTQSF